MLWDIIDTILYAAALSMMAIMLGVILVGTLITMAAIVG
jgi:hypothetical protein